MAIAPSVLHLLFELRHLGTLPLLLNDLAHPVNVQGVVGLPLPGFLRDDVLLLELREDVLDRRLRA